MRDAAHNTAGFEQQRMVTKGLLCRLYKQGC